MITSSLKQENARCLERGEDKYHERQHSGQKREQPVAIHATQLVQFAHEVYSHRSCSNREASTDPYERLWSRLRSAFCSRFTGCLSGVMTGKITMSITCPLLGE